MGARQPNEPSSFSNWRALPPIIMTLTTIACFTLASIILAFCIFIFREMLRQSRMPECPFCGENLGITKDADNKQICIFCGNQMT